MKRLVLLTLVGLLAMVGFATGQISELIYDEGVGKSMCSVPLELDGTTFSKIKTRLPQGWTRTDMWRNYIGCWKIRNDSLFLDSVLTTDSYGNFRPIFIDDIYAKERTASGYFANWVNDSLRVVSGEIIRYVHMGWESMWENEELIAVENGIVKKRIFNANRLVNRGMDGMELSSLLESLELGEISRRITLEVGYSSLDTEGNPISCKIVVLRGSGDEATDDRIVAATEKLILANKALPIYYCDGKYSSDTYIVPIRSSRETKALKNKNKVEG